MKEQNKKPLADLMRPQTLKDFFGQENLVGKTSFLRRLIEGDNIPSMVLWGPPGSGKTTLALIIANQTGAEFITLSAVSSGKKDLMGIIAKAESEINNNKKTILFIDEIHRWNKAQQDALLPCVEKGVITLIGATTENPSFEVNSALVSRSRVFVLKKLEKRDIKKIIQRALRNKNSGLSGARLKKEAIDFLAQMSNGDARMALNTLGAVADLLDKDMAKDVSVENIKEILQKQHLLYDKTGDEHYNIISALHKSMRGNDADAALYWLARMVEGGENPLYIARRLVRFAAEDVGLADNHALILANAVFDACHKLGFPECNVHLSQCVIYLSKTKKSVLAYEAYNKARKDVEKHGNLEVPLHIRNASTKLMKKLGYGNNYKYTPKENSDGQQYFPDELKGRKYID